MKIISGLLLCLFATSFSYADTPDCQKIKNSSKRLECFESANKLETKRSSEKQNNALAEAKRNFPELQEAMIFEIDTCKMSADAWLIMASVGEFSGLDKVKYCTEGLKDKYGFKYKELKLSLAHNKDVSNTLTEWFASFIATLDSILPRGIERDPTYKKRVRDNEVEFARKASLVTASIY